ncbi:MAG: NAD(P)H-dependent oxidoreductase [Promethearchaeota archaeon]
MKVLIVYAHPNPRSFCHAVLESFTKGLKDAGHTFEVLDLYNLGFHTTFKAEDLVQFRGGKMPQDVLDQQEKVSQADAMAFIYPTVGFYLPSILMGWQERIFSFGFAYTAGKEGTKGLLGDKKAINISTTGMSEEFYRASGTGDATKKLIGTVYWLAGIKDYKIVNLYSPGAVGDEVRKKYLEKAYSLGKEF